GLWLCLRILRRGPDWPLALCLGAICGAAALAKLSGLALLPLAALAFAGGLRRAGDRRRGAAQALAALALSGAIAGWWYVRNLALYGDPTGLNRFLDVVGRRDEVPALARLASEWEGFWLSVWAVFGGFDILAEPWVYRVYSALALAGALGLGILAARGIRRRLRGGGKSGGAWKTAGGGWSAAAGFGLRPGARALGGGWAAGILALVARRTL